MISEIRGGEFSAGKYYINYVYYEHTKLLKVATALAVFLKHIYCRNSKGSQNDFKDATVIRKKTCA